MPVKESSKESLIMTAATKVLGLAIFEAFAAGGYGAWKADLETFKCSVSRGVDRTGTIYSCVAPASIPTNRTEGLDGSKVGMIKRREPLGQPETGRVAHAVYYLFAPRGRTNWV